MPSLSITVDGVERQVDAGTTGLDLFSERREVVVMTVDGELRDLHREVQAGQSIDAVTIDSAEGLAVLRHSTAHVLAQAVQDLFPEAKLGIGPPIENGFYYDFDVAEPFVPDDLKRLEKRMEQIVKQGQRFSRRVVTDEAARHELASEPYKLELIGLKSASSDDLDSDVMEVGGTELTMYDNIEPRTGDRAWFDLCRGPHVPTTRLIPAFKLMRSAAAYWRGSEKNPQLQRIYGTAWPSRDELKAHLTFLEEAEKRDHRRLGTELDLFSFPDEIGSGLAVFHPKGGIVRRLMEDYSRQRHEAAAYEFVYSPHITKSNLFETSGHLDWYADGMYPPMQLDGGADYYLKPMNCPFHILIYQSQQRSYRDLPIRYFEFGTVYRYEKSGVVHGLTRVRGMTQDDAHIFTTKEQMAAELASLLDFVLDLLRDYGLTDFYLELSTKPEEKAVGNDDEWAEATEALRSVAEAKDLELVLDEGGGAFYGPKISVQVKDAIGRTWQMSTIQLDFQLPQRFGMEYIGADNERHTPVMIHRALFGSIERFFAVLLEHYAGNFPAWLAPVQVRVLPVRDDHQAYADRIVDRLKAEGFRADFADAGEKLGNRIRKGKGEKLPYILVVGDTDVDNGTVGVNPRGGEVERDVHVDAFVDRLAADVVAHL